MKRWKGSFYFGLWDTAGQEKFSRISSFYCRGAQAAILAYDITDASSLETLSSYVEFLKEADKDCYVVVIGTKLDLVHDDPSKRQVSEDQGREFARKHRAPFFETSAKTNANVNGVFDSIGYHCLASRLSEAHEDGSRRPETSPKIPEPVQEHACCSIM